MIGHGDQIRGANQESFPLWVAMKWWLPMLRLKKMKEEHRNLVYASHLAWHWFSASQAFSDEPDISPKKEQLTSFRNDRAPLLVSKHWDRVVKDTVPGTLGRIFK